MVGLLFLAKSFFLSNWMAFFSLQFRSKISLQFTDPSLFIKETSFSCTIISSQSQAINQLIKHSISILFSTHPSTNSFLSSRKSRIDPVLQMAQESWNKETDTTDCHKPEAPVLCTNNCGFFGSPGTNNLCSKCYRDSVINTQFQTLIEKGPNVVASSSSTTAAAPSQPVSQSLNTLAISEEQTVVGSSEKKCETQIEAKKPLPNRCFLCNKKVGLTGFKCRCGGTFCSSHRYYESHKCSFDYKTAGRDAIAKENPVVIAEKINKI